MRRFAPRSWHAPIGMTVLMLIAVSAQPSFAGRNRPTPLWADRCKTFFEHDADSTAYYKDVPPAAPVLRLYRSKRWKNPGPTDAGKWIVAVDNLTSTVSSYYQDLVNNHTRGCFEYHDHGSQVDEAW